MRLPWPPDRALLRGFGTAIAALLAVASAGAWALGGLGWALPGLGLGSTIGAMSWLRPASIEPAYRGWNAGVDRFIRASRLALAGVCFTVVSVAGGVGSRLRWKPPRADSSGWVERRSRPPFPAGIDSGRKTRAGWAGRYIRWSRESRNAWAIALLPFLFLLRQLGGRQQRSLDEKVYTLF